MKPDTTIISHAVYQFIVNKLQYFHNLYGSLYVQFKQIENQKLVGEGLILPDQDNPKLAIINQVVKHFNQVMS